MRPDMECSACQSSEDPWDGSDVTSFLPGWKRVAAAGGLWALVTLLAVLALLLPPQAMAQTSLPPSEVLEEQQQKSVALSKAQKRLVENYLDLLKQLQVLTTDYRDYFACTRPKQPDECLENLQFITTELRKGTYLEDLRQLTGDMKKLQQTLEAKQTALKQSDQRAFRLSRSLHEELEVVEQFLQRDFFMPLQRDRQSWTQIEAYLKAVKIALASEGAAKQTAVIVSTISNGETCSVVVDLVSEAPLISLLETPPEPVVAQPPPSQIRRHIEFIPRSGGSGILVELADSILVSSASQPIFVTNPIGDLQISGWDRRKLVATSSVELSSDSHRKAKEQAGQIALRVGPESEGTGVELVIPNLTDPNTKVVRCALEIKVPNSNRLIVAHSFGDVTIRQVRSDVTLASSYASVEVDNVEGRVEIANNMGEIELSRIVGPMKVINSHSPVEISRCHGDMEIDNSFSSISLSYSEGDVVIHNSGAVEILRHSGTMKIDNENGQVEVIKLDGDLTVKNSFQPLLIEDIFGSADVKNANAKIRAKNVTGMFSAKNTFGLICGDLLYGPIHLASRNGNIDVTLAEKVAGPSTIEATAGTVTLAIWPHSDLLLTATAVGGGIRSHFPMEIDETGAARTAELLLGTAQTPLTIHGNNTTIIIKKAE